MISWFTGWHSTTELHLLGYPSDFIEEEEEGGKKEGKRERKKAAGIRYQCVTLFSSHCRIGLRLFIFAI